MSRSGPRPRTLATAALAAALLSAAIAARAAETLAPPPAAPVQPVRDSYFGIEIEDPFRNLEHLDDPTVADWMRSQSSYSRRLLDAMPGHEALLTRLRALDAAMPPRVASLAWRAGDLVFYEQWPGDGGAARLVVRHGLDGAERVLLDPDQLPAALALPAEAAGPRTIRRYEPSPGGRFVAAALAAPSATEASVVLLETRTGRIVAGPIRAATPVQIGWLPDETGMFVTRPRTRPGERESSVLLRLGADPQKAPTVLPGAGGEIKAGLPAVFALPGTTLAAGVVTAPGSRFVDLYLAPLDSVLRGRPRWRQVIDSDDQVTAFAAVRDRLFVLSQRGDGPGAAGARLLEISAGAAPGLAHARVVMDAGHGAFQQLVRARDALYATRREDSVTRLWRIGLEPGAAAAEVALPSPGTARIVAADARVPGVLLETQSWLQPRRILLIDGRTANETALQPAPRIAPGTEFVATDVEVTSRDTEPVLLTILQRRDPVRDAASPTLLIAPAWSGHATEPAFAPSRLAWLERWGVIAIVHWGSRREAARPEVAADSAAALPPAGTRLDRVGGWRDLIACARYLVAQRIASPATLGIDGDGDGATLAARAIVEQPDLFAAAIIRGGRLDAVRSAFFSMLPSTEAGMRSLVEASTYAQIRDGVRYPAVLLAAPPARRTGGRNVDAVEPFWNSTKTAARLQQATASGRPVLLLGDGSGDAGSLEAVADGMSFLLWQVGAPGFQAAK